MNLILNSPWLHTEMLLKCSFFVWCISTLWYNRQCKRAANESIWQNNQNYKRSQYIFILLSMASTISYITIVHYIVHPQTKTKAWWSQAQCLSSWLVVLTICHCQTYCWQLLSKKMTLPMTCQHNHAATSFGQAFFLPTQIEWVLQCHSSYFSLTPQMYVS